MSELIPTTECEYNGYIIEYAGYATKQPGEWFGLYRVHKDGQKIFAADVVNPLATQAHAAANAERIGKEYVDGLMAE